MTFSVYNFGCKVNQYESQVMADLMTASGYTLAKDKESADILIINSCTVTAVSDNKVLKNIHVQSTALAIDETIETGSVSTFDLSKAYT